MDRHDDNESVNTEDFAIKFAEMAIEGRRTPNTSPAKSASRYSREAMSSSNLRPGSTGGKGWTTPSLRGSRSAGLNDYQPMDSVRTEDFENKFRSMFSRTTAPVGPSAPVESYKKNGYGGPSMGIEGRSVVSTRRSEVSPTRLGSLTNIPPMRIDIMNKFFDKYSSDAYRPTSPSPPRRGRSKSPDIMAMTPKKGVAFSSKLGAHTLDKKLLDEDISNQIRIRTEQIKREIQNERQRAGLTHAIVESSRREERSSRPLVAECSRREERSSRPVVAESSRRGRENGYQTPREALDHKVQELDRLTMSARRAKSERDTLADELDGLQENLRKNLAEVRMNEKLVKDSRAKADDIRMELMLAEAKRDSTKDDLDRLNSEYTKRKKQLKEIESSIKERLDDIQDLETTGLSKEEIEAVIAERNELYEILKVSEDNENHRYELEKKLTAVKEDLTQEQKRNRETIVALEEELEASFGKIAEMRREKESHSDNIYSADQRARQLEKKVATLQTDLSDLRAENEAIKKEHCLELKKMSESQSENKHRTQNEQEVQLKTHLQQLQETNTRLRAELEGIRQNNESLIEEKENYEYNLNSIKKSKKTMKMEYEDKINKLEEAREKEIDLLKSELGRHQTSELSDIRLKLQKEKDAEVVNLKEVYQKHSDEMQALCEKKEEEITYLKSHIRLQETNFGHVAKEVEGELRAKFLEDLEKEKSVWEEAEEARWKKELDGLKCESTRVIESLQAEIQAERKTSKEMEREAETLRKEVEDNKEKFARELDEKVAEINKLKQKADESLHKVKEECGQEMADKLSSLKTELARSVQAQSSTTQQLESRIEEMSDLVVQLAATVAGELAKDCAKIAEVIKTEQPKIKCKRDKIVPENAMDAITEGLANLRHLIDEAGTFIGEVIQESEKRAVQIKESKQQRQEEVHNVKQICEEQTMKEIAAFKEKMLKEHLEEMEKLAATPDPKVKELVREKENEIRELNANMKRWKEKTAEFLAIKLQNEFRTEFEKKLKQIKRERTVSGSGTQSGTSMSKRDIERLEKDLPVSGTHPDAIKIIGHLKDNVKRLREENLSLRKVLLGKTSLEPCSEDSIISGSIVRSRGSDRHDIVSDHSDIKATGEDSDRTLEPPEHDSDKRHRQRNGAPVHDETVKPHRSNPSSRTSSQQSSHSVRH